MQFIRMLKKLEKDGKDVIIALLNPKAIQAVERIPAPGGGKGAHLVMGPHHYYDVQETFEEIEQVLLDFDRPDYVQDSESHVLHLFPVA